MRYSKDEVIAFIDVDHGMNFAKVVSSQAGTTVVIPLTDAEVRALDVSTVHHKFKIEEST